MANFLRAASSILAVHLDSGVQPQLWPQQIVFDFFPNRMLTSYSNFYLEVNIENSVNLPAPIRKNCSFQVKNSPQSKKTKEEKQKQRKLGPGILATRATGA
jgi:hypothetical protein